MLIDTHAHLNMPQFDADRDDVIKRAYDNGVKLILNVGTSLSGSIESFNLTKKYEYIYSAAGIHPHDVENISESDYKKITELLSNDKVIAVGEVGLDYYKGYSGKTAQINAFKRFIAIAREVKKPLIIHSRDAKVDTLKILRDERAGDVGGILHCFSGDEEMMMEASNLGFYISFAGQVTFPKALTLQEVVKKVPTKNILVETDCPFLAPHPNRGKRNEPSFILYTLEKIAKLRGVSKADMERVSSVNFSNLFKIRTDDYNLTKNISYQIRNSLYLNITNNCTCACTFCSKNNSLYVQGYSLKLDHEPNIGEVINSIDDAKKYDEVVLCGFGEPTMCLDIVKEVCRYIKDNGGKTRLNTNGHGNIINNRNILPDLEGIVDSISVSLNAQDSKIYKEITRPVYDIDVFKKVCEFILESKKYIPNVTATVVDMPDVIDIKKCRKIAKEELGVKFRVRKFNMVGS